MAQVTAQKGLTWRCGREQEFFIQMKNVTSWAEKQSSSLHPETVSESRNTRAGAF